MRHLQGVNDHRFTRIAGFDFHGQKSWYFFGSFPHGCFCWFLDNVYIIGSYVVIVRVRVVLKRQGRTQLQTRSSLQDQMLRLPGFLHCWDWQKPQHKTDWTQTSYEKWWCQQSHCCTSSTDKPQLWLGLCSVLNLRYKLFSTTDWKAGTLT